MLVFMWVNFCVSAQRVHQDPTHNFTVNRLLILNEKGEMLMVREKHVWAPPSYVVEHRQYLKEGLDSLASAYGIQIADIRLRGQFSYKYDYHPYATIRNFYTASYSAGAVKVPQGMDEVRWMPMQQAVDINSVISIKEIVRQIVKSQNTIWGGSFMVSHIGDDHPTKMVEPFYPLF